MFNKKLYKVEYHYFTKGQLLVKASNPQKALLKAQRKLKSAYGLGPKILSIEEISF